MANYFQLYDRKTGQVASFQDIDDKMRLFFKQPADAEAWLWDWYDIIGPRLAFGATFETVIAEMEKLNMDELANAARWLDYHYTVESWSRRG